MRREVNFGGKATNRSPHDKSAEQNITSDLKECTDGLNRILEDLRRKLESSGVDERYMRKISDIKEQFSAINDGISELLHSLSKFSNVNESGFTSSIILRVKGWEDFRALTSNASTVSFLYQHEEKTFQVDALKEGRVYTFSGQIPSATDLLKAWLSKELKVEERKVLEGVLALG